MLLVRQFRVAVGELLLEIPAGTLDVADDGVVEDPDLAARRELEEETGMRAGSWRKLARFYTAPGFTSELMHLYLATDLVPADGDRLGPDEDEQLLLERMPVSRGGGRRRARGVRRREVARGPALARPAALRRRGGLVLARRGVSSVASGSAAAREVGRGRRRRARCSG